MADTRQNSKEEMDNWEEQWRRINWQSSIDIYLENREMNKKFIIQKTWKCHLQRQRLLLSGCSSKRESWKGHIERKNGANSGERERERERECLIVVTCKWTNNCLHICNVNSSTELLIIRAKNGRQWIMISSDGYYCKGETILWQINHRTTRRTIAWKREKWVWSVHVCEKRDQLWIQSSLERWESWEG